MERGIGGAVKRGVWWGDGEGFGGTVERGFGGTVKRGSI